MLPSGAIATDQGSWKSPSPAPGLPIVLATDPSGFRLVMRLAWLCTTYSRPAASRASCFASGNVAGPEPMRPSTRSPPGATAAAGAPGAPGAPAPSTAAAGAPATGGIGAALVVLVTGENAPGPPPTTPRARSGRTYR